MKNIILIGMPACGKSTFGVVLAKTLGMSFVDTDLLIQQQTGRLLQDIIDNDGMDAFLEVEEDVLTHVDAENSVIATGGSAVYSDRGMKYLRTIGEVIYIRLPLEEIRRRLNNIKTRGIAMAPGDTLEDIYNRRIPLYEKYADIVMDSTGLTLEEFVKEFITKFEEN